MRIAFVAEPSASSVDIITARLAARLARRASIRIYRANHPGPPDLERDAAGVEYQKIRITPEKYIHRAIIDLEPEFDTGWFRLPYWGRSIYYRGYARKIARDLITRPVDIVHVHSLSQFVPTIRVLHPQIKIVLHLHSDQFALLDRACVAERLRDVDLVIGPSNHTVQGIRERFPEFADRCRILPHGVDLEHFVPPAGGFGRPEPGVLRCLYVGRVSPEKGLHVLLDGLGRIREEFPRVRLDVYGAHVPLPYNCFSGLSRDPAMTGLKEYYSGSPVARLKSSLVGTRLEYFQALERRHGEQFGRSVFFHGSVPHERLPDAYQKADLFILPSVCHEAFSLVLMEAMACGVPFVATRAGGIVEAAGRAGAGLVVERNDPAALAGAIRALAVDPARRARMGRKGREFAHRSMFAWDRVADALWSYYDGLMELSSEQVTARHRELAW